MKRMITRKILIPPLKTICKRYASSSTTIISDLIGNDTKNTLNTNMFQQEKVTDGHTKIDTGRGKRTGVPEAIYTSGKRPLHVREIMESMANRRRNNSDENNNNNNNNIEPVIATRCSEEVFQFCSETIDNLHYYENARIMTLKEDHERAQKQKETDNSNDTIRGKVCIVCAGTSDVNVAEEIAITLELQSTPRIQVERYYDIGVAGLHRMLSVLPELRDDENDVIVCCAGMDGALPSVLAGLVPQPIIAVPTSIGYGVSQGGMSALNSILNSCSPGVGALNIDNGFGAACLVMKMIRPRGVR